MMKKLLIVCLVFFLSKTISAQSREYQIADISVNVQITKDGLVQIDEHRTYEFMGSFSWADYRLPKQGFSEMRNIRVSEGDTVFMNLNTEEPGTFSVSESDEEIVIRLHYNASDTTRTFTISYELTDALSVGPGWTEFFWTYVASGREKSSDQLDISITLPENVSTDSLHAWTRGADENADIKQFESSYSISARDIHRSQSFQVRTAFPTSVFDENEVNVTDPDLTLNWIRENEQVFRTEQTEREERNAFFNSISEEATILISILSIGIFILLFRKYGTRFPTGSISERETILIPGNIPPALIGRLMSNSVTSGRHLVATLFDLARRGWFTIHEEEKEKTGFFSTDSTEFRIANTARTPDDELTGWEKMIVDHVNEQIEEGNDRFDKLFKTNGFKMTKWFNNWKDQIKDLYEQQNWIDKESYKGVFINLGFQSILLAVSIVFMVFGNPDITIIALLVSIFMMVLSIAIIRRTREGQETYKRWKAYRDGLKNADERTIRMDILDRHFIYAMALHLTQNKIKKVIESADYSDSRGFPWIVLVAGSSHTPASVAASLTTLAATSTSSVSSVSGGGGATAGTAGGGASGGAG